MGQVTQLGLTSVYDRAYSACVEAFQSGPNPMTLQDAKAQVDNSVLSQGYLRLETLLSTGVNAYSLNILNNQTNNGVPIRPTELRLTQQDSFFMSSIAFYVTKAASAADLAFPLLTYPSPTVFTNAANLQILYNGYFKIMVNNTAITPNYPLSDFLQIPQTQKTAATNSPIDQFDPSQVSLIQPNINFVGTNQSTIDIVLPGAPGTLDAFTYLIAVVKGVRAQNITVLV